MVEINQERLIQIFLELSKIDAIAKAERPVADYIKFFFNRLNISVKEDFSAKRTFSNTGNLVIRIGSGRSEFAMIAHMDTAFPTTNVNPRVKPDKIASDGITPIGADDRVGIAVLLYAVEHALYNEIPIRDFALAFTTCGETTMAGAKALDFGGMIKTAYVFDAAYKPGVFINHTAGAKQFLIEVTGRSSNIAINPDKGINAISIAANAIAQLQLGMVEPEVTANIGRIDGGSYLNLIPEKSGVQGEVRSFDKELNNTVMHRIRRTFEKEVRKHKGAKLDVKTRWEYEPLLIPEDDPICLHAIEAIRRVGLVPIPEKSMAGSAASSLYMRKVKAINLGIGVQKPHAKDEFIMMEDFINITKIALELIKKD